MPDSQALTLKSDTGKEEVTLHNWLTRYGDVFIGVHESGRRAGAFLTRESADTLRAALRDPAAGSGYSHYDRLIEVDGADELPRKLTVGKSEKGLFAITVTAADGSTAYVPLTEDGALQLEDTLVEHLSELGYSYVTEEEVEALEARIAELEAHVSALETEAATFYTGVTTEFVSSYEETRLRIEAYDAITRRAEVASRFGVKVGVIDTDAALEKLLGIELLRPTPSADGEVHSDAPSQWDTARRVVRTGTTAGPAGWVFVTIKSDDNAPQYEFTNVHVSPNRARVIAADILAAADKAEADRS